MVISIFWVWLIGCIVVGFIVKPFDAGYGLTPLAVILWTVLIVILHFVAILF